MSGKLIVGPMREQIQLGWLDRRGAKGIIEFSKQAPRFIFSLEAAKIINRSRSAKSIFSSLKNPDPEQKSRLDKLLYPLKLEIRKLTSQGAGRDGPYAILLPQNKSLREGDTIVVIHNGNTYSLLVESSAGLGLARGMVPAAAIRQTWEASPSQVAVKPLSNLKIRIPGIEGTFTVDEVEEKVKNGVSNFNSRKKEQEYNYFYGGIDYIVKEMDNSVYFVAAVLMQMCAQTPEQTSQATYHRKRAEEYLQKAR